MALLTSLFSMLDKRSVGGIAEALGESEQSVSHGMQSSIAAVLGGMASKSQDPNTLGKILDLAPKTSGDSIWSQMAHGVSDPNSPLMSIGKTVLSSLFGNSASAVTSGLNADSGLRSGAMSTLMTMAAPMVMSFLGKRVRDEGMTMSGLGSLLQRETPAIRSALPAGVNDLLWPGATTMPAASPVVAPTVETQRSSNRWIWPLVLLALIPGLFWLFSHARRPVPAPINPVQVTPAPTGAANRVAPDLGDIVKPKLPENVDLRFENGSTKLTPKSQELLNNIAADLTANPDVHIKVGGYTDNVGSAERNLQLSQKRANRVVADLVHKGISPNRLTADGYGDQNPIADNATAAGRALNRRVSVSATRE
jgi:outer membrane protein OmpA-like peptidoglycan-associated protein